MKKKPKSTKLSKKTKSRTPKTKKPKEKLWGLEPRTFPKSVQGSLEMDEKYRTDLKADPKAAAFLSKFNEEFHGNKFKKGPGKRNLHKKSERNAVFAATNARNRDMYAKRYQYQDIEYVASMESSDTTNPQDALIEYMDKKVTIKQFIAEAVKSGLSQEEAEFLTKQIFDLEI